MAKKEKKPRHAGADAAIDRDGLLALFKERGKPLGLREILGGLRADKVHKAKILHLLDTLTEEGRIIRLGQGFGRRESGRARGAADSAHTKPGAPGRRAAEAPTDHGSHGGSHGARGAQGGIWGLADRLNLVVGRLEIQRSGVGFVICDDKRRKDIFVNPRDFGDAWHGDRVAVAVTRERGAKAEGRVVRILERTNPTLSCRVERRLQQGMYLLRPTDPRHDQAFILTVTPEDGTPEIGEAVLVCAGDKLDSNLYAATLVERLGSETAVAVQERLVKLNHNVPGPFPAACVAQAKALPAAPSDADFAVRRDLRALNFVTIDGETARDFDDAIYVEQEGAGFRLWVAIADVSHYVPLGSPLYGEARERGNSYYFPQSVEPMFPAALSNGLCSLNPNVPRLAMVVETAFSGQGVHGESRFYPAVIESKARLTYTQVHRALFLDDEEERQTIEHVLPMLSLAEKLARAIHERRLERGSLDFDLPEPEILFNPQGEAVDIRPREHNFAHQIIEEFMIAANEAVARFLTEHGAPLPYRVHPEPDPDKLDTLFTILARAGLEPRAGSALPPRARSTPKGLQAILAAVQGTDMAFLTSRLMLRAMMQAKYSTVNIGHYGLASECYCHFTSPIRRYADLMVHRGLKAIFDAAPPPVGVKKMQAVCDHISGQERVAMEAEREIQKRMTVLFLQGKEGQRFEGVVSSLADFGFWVEMTEVMAEGMVRLSTLADDYYTFFPERQELLGQRTGRRFRLGQHVRVELTDVHLGRLEVNLKLVDAGDDEVGQGTPARRARKPVRTKNGKPSHAKNRGPARKKGRGRR